MFYDIEAEAITTEDTIKIIIRDRCKSEFGIEPEESLVLSLLAMEVKSGRRFLYIPGYGEDVEPEDANTSFGAQKMYGYMQHNYEVMRDGTQAEEDEADLAEWAISFKLGNGESTGFKISWGAEELSLVENLLEGIMQSGIITSEME